MFTNIYLGGNNSATKGLKPDKPEITNYKHQISNKFQITISKSQIRSKTNCLVRRRRIGHCDLFGICDLIFKILLITET
jgi:predicted nucleotidyltransferase